jgi:hypothetical protein
MALRVEDMISIGRTGPTASPFAAALTGVTEGMQIRQQNEMRRKQLELQKAQLDQQRAHQEAQLALQRQGLGLKQAAADRKAEQARQAALDKKNQENLALTTKFNTAIATGDIAGAEALIPEMEGRGMALVREGDEGGMPKYRIYQDRKELEREEQELARQQKAAAASDVLPESVSVQRGGSVVDAGRATALRTGPARSALEAAGEAFSDEERRRQHQAAADAALKMPGSAKDQLDAYSTFFAEPSKDYRGRQKGETDLQIARENRAQAQDTRQSATHIQGMRDVGFKRAKEGAETIDLPSYGDTRSALSTAREALSNKSSADDYLAGSLVSRSVGSEKGPLSDKDMRGVLGDDYGSFVERIQARLYKEAFGGLSAQKRDALLKLVQKKETELENKVLDYVDRVEKLAEEEENPEVKRGYTEYLRLNVDEGIVNKARARRKSKEGKLSAISGDPGDKPASANPSTTEGATGSLMFEGSQGLGAKNNNPGNLRFAKQKGATVGEKGFAKFETMEAGFEALKRQLDLYKERGHTILSGAKVYAPREDNNDPEAWAAGVAKQLGVSVDTPMSELDTTELARAVSLVESSTKVTLRQDGKAPVEKQTLEQPLQPRNEKERRLLMLLNK